MGYQSVLFSVAVNVLLVSTVQFEESLALMAFIGDTIFDKTLDHTQTCQKTIHSVDGLFELSRPQFFVRRQGSSFFCPEFGVAMDTSLTTKVNR